MTPTQRRELERLIDAHRTATTEMAATRALRMSESECAGDRFSATLTELNAFIDGLTDYSTAEAVSGR